MGQQTKNEALRRPDVVLGADPLVTPAAGIGKYTRGLLRGLMASGEMGDLRLYASGRFLDPVTHARPDANPITVRGESASASGRMRTLLAKSPLAVTLYAKTMPWLSRLQLRRYAASHVFHSPNFLLPDFPGPCVTTFHDLSIQRFPDFHPAARVRLMEREMTRAVDRAAHILTPSALVREEVCRHYGLADEHVTAVAPGVDGHFYPRDNATCAAVLDRLGLDYGRFFLFTGTVEPRKNILRICAAQRLARSHSGVEWPLVFVGGRGWSSAAEHAAIAALENQGLARYLGFVADDTLAVLYAAAGGLVFPSIYEGFGLPALEAQCSACPVITSKASAMAEFACYRDILVEPLDSEAIAAAMIEMASGAHAERLRHAPVGELPGTQFSWQTMAAHCIALYGQLQP